MVTQPLVNQAYSFICHDHHYYTNATCVVLNVEMRQVEWSDDMQEGLVLNPDVNDLHLDWISFAAVPVATPCHVHVLMLS